jgi:hypothetical protein
MVTRTRGDRSSRLTAIYCRARTRSRLARLSAFHRSHRRSRRRPVEHERYFHADAGDTGPQDAGASVVRQVGLPGLLLALALILVTGCGGNARAQTLPTPIPQPTPDRTMDAIIRGLVTVVVPTATRASGAATTAPAHAEPAPRAVEVSSTPTLARATSTQSPAPATPTAPPRTPTSQATMKPSVSATESPLILSSNPTPRSLAAAAPAGPTPVANRPVATPPVTGVVATAAPARTSAPGA